MTEKSEIEREIVDEAYRRGKDYLKLYACADGVFAAVMDTLGYENDPVVKEVFKATVGLIGGTGHMADFEEFRRPRVFLQQRRRGQ